MLSVVLELLGLLVAKAEAVADAIVDRPVCCHVLFALVHAENDAHQLSVDSDFAVNQRNPLMAARAFLSVSALA